jgi:triosephosphate isomerase
MNADKNKVYVVGNWKMNPVSEDDADTLFDEIENDVYKLSSDRVEVVACPPYLFLSEFDAEGRVKLGAQDLFWESRGAFTGEISADMLRRVGVKYALVGHSERRYYLGENDEMVNLKLAAALAGNLRPILCVGETLEEKQRGEADKIIVGQLDGALNGISAAMIHGKLLIAYEPVWAVGTGLTPTTDEVMSTGLLIKKVLSRIYGSREIAEDTPLLYGGSVDAQNCLELVEKTGFQGLLVGGASLRASEFMGIVKSFAK